MDTSKPLRVMFCFSAHGLGGTEQSMFRLMQSAHPNNIHCVVVAAPNSHSETEARKTNLPVFALKRSDFWGYLRTFRQVRPDVVYLFGRIRTIPWAFAARIARVPCVIAAERGCNGRLDRVTRILDQWWVDGYITNSNAAANAIRSYITRSLPVHTIYNGIENASGKGKRSGETDLVPVSASPIILCIANLLPLKGHGILAKAAGKLRETYPRLKVVFVGSDHSQGRIMQNIENAGLGDIVSWVGFQPDIWPYLTNADVFVLPSLYIEGTPTSILEAMLAKVPVVASTVGGIPELVEHHKTGWLTQPGDVEGMANAINEVLTQAPLRASITKAAYEQVLRRHSLEEMRTRHIDAFEKTLTRGSLRH